MGRDYEREERVKETGERQKSQQNGRDYQREERPGGEGHGRDTKRKARENTLTYRASNEQGN